MQVTRLNDPDFNNFAGMVAAGWFPNDELTEGADQLAEFAGRNCYQAWERKNPKTATNEGYLNNILNQGHYSVLAHASVSFYAEGISRALTHELIRSRFLVFSEVSQRYVDMADSYTVVPPLFHNHETVKRLIADHHAASVELYDTLQEIGESLLEEQGAKGFAKRKQANQAARYVLPGGTETKIVVSGNIRAWRDFIAQRWSEHADAEIREFAGTILDHLREIAPNSVQDIPEEPYA